MKVLIESPAVNMIAVSPGLSIDLSTVLPKAASPAFENVTLNKVIVAR